jgi:RimJ/RimL family protein N-acetyltransferase
MSEAIALAAGFGWKNMRLTRVYAITTLDNEPAIRLLERLGFEKTSETAEGLVTYDLRLTT